MTPFSATPSHSELSLGQRLLGRTPVIIFLVLLVPGLTAVGWRAFTRVEARKTQARAQAVAHAAALKMELDQATTAVEALAAMAGQGVASVGAFEKSASQLLLSRPGLATLEWQPGGILSGIVPRAGNERALGQNLLKEPAQRNAAYAAIQGRALLVIGPIPMHRGEFGFVARMPVFVRGRDGRESFWGFVTASLRLRDMLGRSELDGLWARGYEYRLFIPKSNTHKALSVAGRGGSSMADALQEPIRAFNLELRLALQPRGGWFGLSQMALQLLWVVLSAGLVALLAALREERHDTRALLSELGRKLSRETSEKTQAQDECRTAKTETAALQSELTKSTTALRSAETTLSELQKQFEGMLAASREVEETSQQKLGEAESIVTELQKRLNEQARVAGELLNGNQAGLRQARAELDQARKEVTQVRSQLEASDLQARKSADAASRQRERDQSAIAGLQAKLETLAAAARTEAEAQARKLEQAGHRIRELEALAVSTTAAQALPAEAPATLEVSQASPEPEPPDGQAAPSSEPQHEADVSIVSEERTSEADLVPASETVAADAPAAVPEAVEVSQSPNFSTTVVLEPETPKPGPGSPIVLESVETVSLPPVLAEPAAGTPSAGKIIKKRKARRDLQIDLFEAAAPAPESPAAAGEPVLPETAPSMALLESSSPEPAETELGRSAAESAEMLAAASDEASVVTASLPVTELEGGEAEKADSESSAAEEPVEFPAVPGLALPEGLALADGDSTKYLKALQHFAAHYRKAPEKIRDSMVQGDTPSAERALNGLKVAAGEIGAVVLREAAGKLDQAMHGESEPAEVEFLWLEVDKNLRELLVGLKPLLETPEEPAARVRPAASRLKVDLGQLRKAVNQILPLLTDQDPGAKDCFKDNRSVFRPAFAPETFEEFEQAMKKNNFELGLELLKKAAKKHGIT